MIFAFVILAAAAFCTVKKKNQKVYIWNTPQKAECLILSFTVLFYFALVAQISPEIVDRYQFMIYPFCVLLTVMVTFFLFRLLGKERLVWAAASVFLLFILQTYTARPVPYVYKGYQDVIGLLGNEYKNVPGIYITAGDHLLINNCLFLAQQDMTYSLILEQSDKIPGLCGKINAEDMNTEQLILYVDIYYQEFQTAEEIAESSGYSSYTLLYDNTFTKIFLLSR